VHTPFGVSLRGIRDEHVRMTSLGYVVPLHRTLAFGFADTVTASVACPWPEVGVTCAQLASLVAVHEHSRSATRVSVTCDPLCGTVDGAFATEV
jgi:hypothetical protein